LCGAQERGLGLSTRKARSPSCCSLTDEIHEPSGVSPQNKKAFCNVREERNMSRRRPVSGMVSTWLATNTTQHRTSNETIAEDWEATRHVRPLAAARPTTAARRYRGVRCHSSFQLPPPRRPVGGHSGGVTRGGRRSILSISNWRDLHPPNWTPCVISRHVADFSQ
jgi:hypothetical protein